MSVFEKSLFTILFVLVIGGVGLFGFLKYDLIMGPDHYRYVTEGVSLARGRLGEDFWLARVFPESPYLKLESGGPFGNAWVKGGEIYVIHPLGWPLLLAVGFLLGGEAGIFLTNPFLLLFLLLGQFFFIRELIFDRKERDWIALLSVFLLIQLPRYRLLFSSLHPSRDVPALTFYLWGVYFLLRSFRGGEKVNSGFLFLAAGLSAFGCLVRQTAVLLLLPAGVYLWTRLGKKKALLIPIVAFFLLSGAVLLAENYLTSDLWFPQLSYLFSDENPWEVETMVSTVHFLPHLQRYLVWIYHLFPVSVLALALIGAVVLGRRKEMWFFLIVPPLVAISFFSLFKYAFPRYIYFTFPALAALVACGSWEVIRLTSRLKNKSSTFQYGLAFLGLGIIAVELVRLYRGPGESFLDLILLAIGLYLFFGGFRMSRRAAGFFSTPAPLAIITAGAILAYLLPTLFPAGNRTAGKEFRLAAELENSITAPEALLLAERNLTYNLDFHTRFYSIRPTKLREFSGLSLPEAVKKVRETMEVYILDNKGKRSAGRYVARLDKYFSLLPVKRFNVAALGLLREDFIENELLTLYRVGEPRGGQDER